MSTKILNQSQAEAVYSAMCHLNNIGARADMSLSGPNVSVREDTLGRIVIKKWGVTSEESHANQSAFATAYGLQQG